MYLCTVIIAPLASDLNFHLGFLCGTNILSNKFNKREGSEQRGRKASLNSSPSGE